MNFRYHHTVRTCLKLVDTFNLSRHAKYESIALMLFYIFIREAIHTFVSNQLALFCYLHIQFVKKETCFPN